jgi:hypothetical protein
LKFEIFPVLQKKLMEIPVFVDFPDGSSRRMSMNGLFPVSVFRLEIARFLKTNPEKLRLWLKSKDNESLMDLTREASQVPAGSRFELEIANANGEFCKVERYLPESTEKAFIEASKQVMESVPHQQRQQTKPPGDSPHRPVVVAPIRSASPRPPPPASAEEQQVRAAMEASLANQSSALEREEALMMALASAGKKMRKMRDDGNCLFRALSDRFPAAGDHRRIRSEVVAHMAKNPQRVFLFLGLICLFISGFKVRSFLSVRFRHLFGGDEFGP